LGLSSAFAETGDASGHVAVLEREPAIYASSSQAEIVTCRTDGGQRVYWQLRWLEQGDVFEWRFKELRAAGERLGPI
jgi:hypothetical protein